VKAIEALNGFRRHSLDQRALDTMAFLQETGGATLTEAADALGWSRHQAYTAIQHARNHVAPQLGLAIPRPVPEDGHRYHVTGEWISVDGTPAIEAGTSYAMGQIESQLRSVYRDIQVAKGNANPRSIMGRKINFLDKRLSYIFETLEDIGSSVDQASVA
jgi:hypothetical protein